MLKNYLKIAYRNMIRQKGYAFINIFGLAAGLACFILILLFVQHELSYDTFHEQDDRIYRVIQQRPGANGSVYWAVTSPALANTLVNEFPEVKVAASVTRTRDPLLTLGEKHYQDEGILADPHFFDVFTFPLLQGDAGTALAAPNSIVLTQSFARKMFGQENPVGQTLLYQNKDALVVTGIVADVPEKSHLSFEYVLPAESHIFYREGVTRQPWYNNGWFTYAVLEEGASAEQVEGKMRTFIDAHLADWRPEDRMQFLFQPLGDIHLRSPQPILGNERSGDVSYVYLFSAVGFLILLLACVNYTNLAVARSIKRAREVGLRRVVGAARGQLIGQFLGESLLTAFLALVLALGLVHLLLPFFGHLMERPIRMDYLDNALLLPGLVALVGLVGLLSGSYPAFFMVSLRPIEVLTGKQKGRASRFRMQRLLIVGQFAVSIALVAGSLIVYEQLQYVQQKDLGYDREHVVAVRANDPALSQNFARIRDEWLRNPRVVGVTYSKHLPTNVQTNQSMFDWEGSEGELLPSRTTGVDYDFLDVYGIDLVAGRAFSRAFATDSDAFLINETAAGALGWTPDEAVGKQFRYTDDRAETPRTIIGVMKDFHFNSIQGPLESLVLTLDMYPTGFISVKVRPDDLPETIALFEKTVTEFTSYPFEFQFLDDSFDQLYKNEARLGETLGFFTVIALLIASLGLFGLAAYSAEQRTKEIGIRKALGATVSGLVALLSSEFLKLVGLAFVVAAPLAYFAMQRWLEDFAYHIELGPGIFLTAGATALIISLASVSYQAIKAARANPVKSLRYE